MSMTRFRRIAELWNWLPGFRAVAEHQSVHGAATTLHVSPSSLSRTVKLLEDAIGSELFTRKAAGLELTAFGAELVAVTRDTMRQLDDCIEREHQRRGGVGPFYVGAACEVSNAVIARALAGGLDGFGVVDVVRIDGDLADELHQGNVDLVVTVDVPRQSDLVAARLGDVGFAVYAAVTHPRAGSRPVPLDALGDTPCVVVRGLPELAGAPTAVRTDSIHVARGLCENAPWACVLPRLGWSPLVQLAAVGEQTTLHAVHRVPLPTAHDDRRVATFVERLQAAVRSSSPEVRTRSV
jgi:DNA-binding transcriptional LysR family regulator